MTGPVVGQAALRFTAAIGATCTVGRPAGRAAAAEAKVWGGRGPPYSVSRRAEQGRLRAIDECGRYARRTQTQSISTVDRQSGLLATPGIVSSLCAHPTLSPLLLLRPALLTTLLGWPRLGVERFLRLWTTHERTLYSQAVAEGGRKVCLLYISVLTVNQNTSSST